MNAGSRRGAIREWRWAIVDTTLDALLEVVRKILELIRFHFKDDRLAVSDIEEQYAKLDALIAQRKGRPDDEPATGPMGVGDWIGP